MIRRSELRALAGALCLIGACAQGAEIEEGEVVATQGVGGSTSGSTGGGGPTGTGGSSCAPTPWYEDADGDGFGSDAAPLVECAQPAGYAAQPGDCNDADAAVHPGGVEVCNGADDDCEGGADEDAVCAAGCTGALDPTSGHSYALCASGVSWGQGSSGCAAMGMKLVRIDDAAERDWVRAEASALGLGELWIGASDQAAEGQWVWPDGAQFWSGGSGGMTVGGLYASWNGGEPNDDGTEDCAKMNAGGSWHDTECGNNLPTVCELY